MIAFVGFMAAAMLVMLFAPLSSAAKLLHMQMVELPLQAIAKMERYHVIMIVIMAGLMISGGEIMALAGPELLAAYAVDMAIYLDLVIVSYAVSGARIAQAAFAHMRLGLSGLLRRPEAGRRRRTTAKKDRSGPANDDDADPAFTLRMAA